MRNSDLTAASAMMTAERLSNLLGAQDFAFSGHRVKLNVSIGVAYSKRKSAVAETLLARADQAFNQA